MGSDRCEGDEEDVTDATVEDAAPCDKECTACLSTPRPLLLTRQWLKGAAECSVESGY